MRSPRPQVDFRELLSRQVQNAATALAEDVDDHALHQARVALKKARALVRVGAASAPGLADLFQTAARATMRNLAPARDLLVQEHAAALAAAEAKGKRARALTRVAHALEAMRLTAPPADVAAARQGLRDLLALAQVWPENSERQLRRGAKAVSRRARRARRRGIGSHSVKRRHDWRMREKDRLLASGILGDAWPCKRRLRLSSRLTDALGKEHDIALLIERLESAPPAVDKPKTNKRALAALRERGVRLAALSDALGEELRRRGG